MASCWGFVDALDHAGTLRPPHSAQHHCEQSSAVSAAPISRAACPPPAGEIAEGQPMVGSQQPANPPLSPLASPSVQGGETQPAQNASRRSLGSRGGSRKGATLSELMSQRSLQVGPALLSSCQAAQQSSCSADMVDSVSHNRANLSELMSQCSL